VPSPFCSKKNQVPEHCQLRSNKYLNNLIEEDHRFIKRRVKAGLGFWSFLTAWRTLRGYEIMHMIRKGQLRGAKRGDVVSQNRLIAEVFGLA
jgi:IS6 family transposase